MTHRKDETLFALFNVNNNLLKATFLNFYLLYFIYILFIYELPNHFTQSKIYLF